jgi:hypothetical protein
MVIDDHNVQTDRGGMLQRPMGHGTAVDGDHQVSALPLQAVEGSIGRTITFGHPVRHIDRQVVPHMTEPAHQLRRGGGAIDVIVGKNTNPGLGLQRIQHGRDSTVHVHEAGRIGKERLQRRIYKCVEFVRRDAAPGNEPRQRIDKGGFCDIH